MAERITAMPTKKNLCAKTVKKENAYEVWQSYDGAWTWYVLKKYQTPEMEATNPYARWFCAVVSPFTPPSGEMGDCYIDDIKSNARKIQNPLSQTA